MNPDGPQPRREAGRSGPAMCRVGLRARWWRNVWFCLGSAMLALGIVGAVLPVMPTTVFLILAVGCFSRSSPRLEARLLGHARYGGALRLWREQGAVTRQGKCLAGAGMALGYALYLWAAHPGWRPATGVGLLFAASAAYVLSRPAPRDGGAHTRGPGR